MINRESAPFVFHRNHPEATEQFCPGKFVSPEFDRKLNLPGTVLFLKSENHADVLVLPHQLCFGLLPQALGLIPGKGSEGGSKDTDQVGSERKDRKWLHTAGGV